ncbi:uncharacterized protein I206_104902 [Kwoniella pini CBS 10737]|uniref:Uncharacterized protein n=1 Tax=Kwoniella pini CBS 10737 TaxID=1296096 RepID=A0A1B9I870_9TREE|nr:uncharacterized protein I206_02442 [Kwoniella pini CBS 10737]OCF51727.1 hypothetical protein I206_02442 [Kwoniella pini CBS 10737]
MSLQDRLASQESLSLITTATGLSLITAGSTTGFGYNFPLMLFGIISHEMHSTTIPFRQFISLILFTALFDIYSLISHKYSFLILIFTILLFLIKIPIFLSCLLQLRERGSDLSFGNWNLPNNVNLPGGGNWSVPSMPGGFTSSTNQSQNQSQSQGNQQSQQNASFPSSGGFRLGGEEDEDVSTGNQPPLPPPGRNGYSTIA